MRPFFSFLDLGFRVEKTSLIAGSTLGSGLPKALAEEKAIADDRSGGLNGGRRDAEDRQLSRIAMPVELPEEPSIQEGYAAWAPSYDDDGNPLIALEGPAVSAWFGSLDGARALDLGCGTGRHTGTLTAAGAYVWALDLTPEMMAKARAKQSSPHICWIRHALPHPLPFRSSTFNVVVLGLVAEHIADLKSLLSEAARVLVPGGRCILSALHPDRTAAGQRARFLDPETGLRRPITTFHRTAEDYLQAGAAAGLVLQGEQTLSPSPELADRLPRARPYLGQALGYVVCWTSPNP